MHMNVMKGSTATPTVTNGMATRVDVQFAYQDANTPKASEIKAWVKSTLKDFRKNTELTVRVVDKKEATELNEHWRKATGPTNVLSFPCDDISGQVPDLLGDIVICAPVVAKEASHQKKKLNAHWAHMVVHGTLHLLGFDHVKKRDAEKMESLEITILDKLGFDNPYIQNP